jgi:hypothetical protein
LGAEKTRHQPVLVIAQGKMVENGDESHLSNTGFVGRQFGIILSLVWLWIFL